MSWYWIVIISLVAYVLGYITKDLITDEYVSNVTIHKPKIKGGGEMDLDQTVVVKHKKLTLKERRAARRAKRTES